MIGVRWLYKEAAQIALQDMCLLKQLKLKSHVSSTSEVIKVWLPGDMHHEWWSDILIVDVSAHGETVMALWHKWKISSIGTFHHWHNLLLWTEVSKWTNDKSTLEASSTNGLARACINTVQIILKVMSLNQLKNIFLFYFEKQKLISTEACRGLYYKTNWTWYMKLAINQLSQLWVRYLQAHSSFFFTSTFMWNRAGCSWHHHRHEWSTSMIWDKTVIPSTCETLPHYKTFSTK